MTYFTPAEKGEIQAQSDSESACKVLLNRSACPLALNICRLHLDDFRSLHDSWSAAEFRDVSTLILWYFAWSKQKNRPLDKLTCVVGKIFSQFVQILTANSLSQQDETWWFDRRIVFACIWARLICRSRSGIYRFDFQPAHRIRTKPKSRSDWGYLHHSMCTLVK